MIYFLLHKGRALFARDVNDQTTGIAKDSFAHNRRDGIAGFLHAEYGAFYQNFEGKKPVVEALFDRIQADKRQSRITLIASGKTDKRLFSDFDKGFSSGSGRKIVDSFSEDPDRPSAQTIIQFLQEARDEQSSARCNNSVVRSDIMSDLTAMSVKVCRRVGISGRPCHAD